MKKITIRLLFYMALLVLIAACGSTSPIIVIVTPTHEATTAAPTSLPTTTPTTQPSTATPLPPTTAAPNIAQAQTAVTAVTVIPPTTTIASTTIPPTTTPTDTATFAVTGNATPAVATFGAVIGPGYQSPTPVIPTPTIPGTIIVPTLVPTTPGPSPTPLPILQSKLMGIQIHGYLKDDEWNGMLAHAKTLGVGWIKVQIQWKDYEPARDVYNDLYAAMQLRVQRAHLQGFKTLISITKAPDWARGSGQHSEDGPPADPQDFANFLTRLVREYKPEFIDAIEVWNEPNLSREWNGTPLSGTAYLKLFDAAYRAIRLQEQASPKNPSDPDHRITIIAAAPASGTPNAPTSINDRDWVRQLYAAGLANYGTDIALGVHPYGWANAPDATCCSPAPGITGWYENRGFYFKDTLDDYRAIMAQNNHSGAKLWVTEFGWATYDGLHRSDGSVAGVPSDAGFGWLRLLNQRQQADYTVRAFNMVQRPPYSDFMGPMMLWNLNFGTIPTMIDNGREEAGFSLLDYNGSMRPVYQALASAPKQ